MAIPVPSGGRIFERRTDPFNPAVSFYLYGYFKNGTYIERWLTFVSILSMVGKEAFDKLIDNFTEWKLAEKKKKDALSDVAHKNSKNRIPAKLKEKFTSG